jgi:hypothetical protein
MCGAPKDLGVRVIMLYLDSSVQQSRESLPSLHQMRRFI